MLPRTDLAMEAKELFERSAGEQTRLSGVLARETDRRGVRMTLVRILDAEGEQALGKPRGTYITAELDALARREPGALPQRRGRSAGRCASCWGRADRRSSSASATGRSRPTPSGRGRPQSHRDAASGLRLPEALTGLTSVAACQPGVLGQTGIESLALVKSAMQTAQPDVVIVIDALAAAEPGRLFRTVQLTDTGIVPGSGVGNSRQEFSQRTLGVPVVAVGVPTVMDAAGALQPALTRDMPQGLLVTLRDWTRGCGKWDVWSATAAIWRCTAGSRLPRSRRFCRKNAKYRYVNYIMFSTEQIAAKRRVWTTMWKCGKALGAQKFSHCQQSCQHPCFWNFFMGKPVQITGKCFYVDMREKLSSTPSGQNPRKSSDSARKFSVSNGKAGKY